MSQTQIIHNTQNINIAQAQTNCVAAMPKKKPKKKKQKLDLANIMKLSGIGDEDDIQFESDTSQSESEHSAIHLQQDLMHQHQTTNSEPHIMRTQAQANILQADAGKRIGDIHISAMAQPTMNATATPLVQVSFVDFHILDITNIPT